MPLYKSFSQAHALIIGIAEYQGNNRLPDIVTKDAKDIANTLKAENFCGYEKSNVKLLLNSEATLSNIRHKINKIASKAKPDDTVFIYFTGHGGSYGDFNDPASFLVPFDANKSLESLLHEHELSKLLSSINSDRLLVVIDACHSGGVASFKSITKEYTGGIADKSLERLSKGKGKVLFASSRASEVSLVIKGDKNSLFTKHFLSALKGNTNSSDEFIRVFDIFEYLEKNVNREAKSIGREQHPILKVSLENNFAVALRCGGLKSVETNTDLVNNEIVSQDKKLESILVDLYPEGPKDQDIWLRAGGDISRLKLHGTGKSQWYSALRTLSQGGGGSNISLNSLLLEAMEDFPNHSQLIEL